MVIPGREPLHLTPGNIVLVEPSPGDESFTHQAINLSATEEMKTLYQHLFPQDGQSQISVRDRVPRFPLYYLDG